MLVDILHVVLKSQLIFLVVASLRPKLHHGISGVSGSMFDNKVCISDEERGNTVEQ